jgi:hypothetical protein
VSAVPAAPAYDLDAILRSVPMDADIAAFDGSRRRRRVILRFVIFVLVVFGGLFAALAESWTHAHK